jgi:hypothetical protein
MHLWFLITRARAVVLRQWGHIYNEMPNGIFYISSCALGMKQVLSDSQQYLCSLKKYHRGVNILNTIALALDNKEISFLLFFKDLYLFRTH